MYEIMEHFGEGLLELLAVSGTIAIVLSSVGNGGAFQDMVISYLFGICG